MIRILLCWIVSQSVSSPLGTCNRAYWNRVIVPKSRKVRAQPPCATLSDALHNLVVIIKRTFRFDVLYPKVPDAIPLLRRVHQWHTCSVSLSDSHDMTHFVAAGAPSEQVQYIITTLRVGHNVQTASIHSWGKAAHRTCRNHPTHQEQLAFQNLPQWLHPCRPASGSHYYSEYAL